MGMRFESCPKWMMLIGRLCRDMRCNKVGAILYDLQCRDHPDDTGP